MADLNRGAGISLMVPYRNDHEEGRADNWKWLRQYWEHVLPEAEIILGDAPGNPFSKTCAVNAAYRQSSGDVLVQIDADCYIDAAVILECANEIRQGRDRSEPVWFIPYRHLFRLTRVSTLFLIASDPENPFHFDSPPDEDQVGPTNGSGFGHWYGALIQIYPRQAFETVQGMEPRFRGWGGEDVAFVLALDTLFGVHRLTNNQVLTLWHTVQAGTNPDHTKTNPNLLRVWEGQDDPRKNWNLAGRYRKALRDPAAMRKLINEWTGNPLYAQHRVEPPT
jgi:glycosyltransferase involved in cell wall biosynthesis